MKSFALSAGTAPTRPGRLPGARLARSLAALLTVLSPVLAQAIYVYDGTPPYIASAPLNFELTIGKFLYLQVGSTGTTINTVNFSLTGAVPLGVNQVYSGALPGTGAPIAATSGGVQTVIVRGNQGTITLSVAGSGTGLSNGSGGIIAYNQILISSSNGGLPAPVIGAGGTGSSTVAATAYSGKVTDQTANWTFQLANSVVPTSGTYTGQLSFTVTMP